MDGYKTDDRIIKEENIGEFQAYLIREEKSRATVEKYVRDVRAFLSFVGERETTKELAMAWKESLMEDGYAPRSVNSMLVSLNSMFAFLGWENCRVKNLRVQQQSYSPEEKELTRTEYERLLEAAKKRPRLHLVMETICGTGIRVSELKYFEVEAVKAGEIRIRNKGKIRSILIPGKLKRKLLDWAEKNGIQSGAIFITKNGNPLDRSNIWSQMKKLCAAAGVGADKVFPHNLRKLFARCFYELEKDIAKLADVLGHSSINTTRIYLMTTGTEHRRLLERLELVV